MFVHSIQSPLIFIFLFFIAPSSTETYPLSLHDALPICRAGRPVRPLAAPLQSGPARRRMALVPGLGLRARDQIGEERSEEHTSELQSLRQLVCRLLL